MSDADTVSLLSLALWPMLTLALVLVDCRHGRVPLFLVYSYIAGLALNHWFGALVHSMPSKPFASSINTIEGFDETSWGLFAFVLGAAVAPGSRLNTFEELAALDEDAGWRAANCFLFVGAASFMLQWAPVSAVPSATSLISAGKQLLIAGICIKCWMYWREKQLWGLLGWIALASLFPVYSTLALGFMGLGVLFLMTVLIFVGTFYRPRWQLLLAGALALYAGLSLWVAYIEHRAEIRSAVWSGQSLERRIDVISDMLASITPFDLENPEHLRGIDMRLNQNELIGATISYVPSSKDYAHGATLYTALLAMIPRAIWPDKPVVGDGEGQMNASYTGMIFAEGTGIGTGQVMEFYANFGWSGVVIGLFLCGFVLRLVDFKVARALRAQAWGSFGLWFAVGASAVQPLGTMAEVASSVAGAIVLGLLVRRYLKQQAQAQSSPLLRQLH